MATRRKLPGYTLENGICIVWSRVWLYTTITERRYTLVGRLDDGTPFQFFYQGAVTHWECSRDLGLGLRRKILDGLRQDVRFVDEPPEWLAVHDLTALESPNEAMDRIEADFRKDVWRDRYLDDRDEDYVLLDVPFAEKDAAKALGAAWNPGLRRWWVHGSKVTDAFDRWRANDVETAPGP